MDTKNGQTRRAGKYHAVLPLQLLAIGTSLPSPQNKDFEEARANAYKNGFNPLLNQVAGTKQVPGVELKAKDWAPVISGFQDLAKVLGVNDYRSVKRRIKVLKDRAELESKQTKGDIPAGTFVDQIGISLDTFIASINGVPSIGHVAVERLTMACDQFLGDMAKMTSEVRAKVMDAIDGAVEATKVRGPTIEPKLAEVRKAFKQYGNGYGGHGPQQHQPTGQDGRAQQQQAQSQQ